MNVVVWQKRINTGAFILAICCVVSFLVFPFRPVEMELNFHLHPLMMNLWLAVITFFLGVIGFSGVTNGRRFIMSMATLLITFILSVLFLYILLVGKLLS